MALCLYFPLVHVFRRRIKFRTFILRILGFSGKHQIRDEFTCGDIWVPSSERQWRNIRELHSLSAARRPSIRRRSRYSRLFFAHSKRASFCVVKTNPADEFMSNHAIIVLGR